MTVYRFEAEDGRILRLDTETATLLLSTRWSAGRDQTRWIEVYKTKSGRYVQINLTLWQGERDSVHLIEEAEALHRLALSEHRQRTDEGDALLAQAEPELTEEA